MPDTVGSDEVLAAPVGRDVVVVEGPDAASYLQGQLSQDVADLAVDRSTWSLLLSPQGKMVAWVRVGREAGDRFVLDLDAGHGDAVVARLSRFLLRTKATVSPIAAPTDAGAAWALRGAPEALLLPDWDPPDPLYLDAPWSLTTGSSAGAAPRFTGRDLVGHEPFPPPAGSRVVEPQVLDGLRIRAGVPAMGAEITEDTIPAELGQWLIDASVSFTKGCYTGQELVARVDSRGGNVPRTIRVVEIDGSAAAEDDGLIAGAELLDGDRSVVGHLTSVAPDPLDASRTVALASVARSVDAQGTAATVAGHPARVCPRT